MRNQNLPSGFSPFTWAIAAFCFPIFLWPLAMLISPNLLNNTHLSDNQITAMSVFLWVYPFLLGIVARVFYKLHQRRPAFARRGLALSAVIFYGIFYYIASVGFNAYPVSNGRFAFSHAAKPPCRLYTFS